MVREIRGLLAEYSIVDNWWKNKTDSERIYASEKLFNLEFNNYMSMSTQSRKPIRV